MKVLYYLLFLFFCNPILANHQFIIDVDKNNADLNLFLKNKYTVLEDFNNNYTIDSVLKHSNFFHFSEFENHLGFNTNHTWWLKIVIYNKANVNQDYIFEFANVHLDSIDVYKFEKNEKKIIVIGKTGDLYPFEIRNLPSRNFDFVFQANKNAVTELYVRIRQINESISLPIYLYSVPNFYKSENLFVVLIAVGIGVLAFMALFGFVLFCFQKQIMYLYYMLYVLAIIGWLISNYGIGYQLFWSNSPSFHFVSGIIFSIFYIIFFMLFITQFLNEVFKKYYLLKITYFISFFLMGLNIYVLYNKDTIKYNHFFWELFYPLLLVIIIYMGLTVALGLFKKPRKEVFYLGFVYLLTVGSVSMAVLREIFVFPINFLTEHLIVCMAFAEVLSLGLAIAYQLYRFVIEREQYLQERNQFQTELINAEISIQERERNKIANDLHDDLGPTLALAKFALTSPKKIDIGFAVNQIDASINKIRDISHELHPSIVSNLGLKLALQSFVGRITTDYGLKIYIQFKNLTTLSDEKSLHLYRIMTEIMYNCVKHAKASICEITFEVIDNQLYIYVFDNGKGFSVNSNTKGIGLKNIQNRIDFLHGTLKIEQLKPKGTKIEILIPNTNLL